MKIGESSYQMTILWLDMPNISQLILSYGHKSLSYTRLCEVKTTFKKNILEFGPDRFFQGPPQDLKNFPEDLQDTFYMTNFGTAKHQLKESVHSEMKISLILEVILVIVPIRSIFFLCLIFLDAKDTVK